MIPMLIAHATAVLAMSVVVYVATDSWPATLLGFAVLAFWAFCLFMTWHGMAALQTQVKMLGRRMQR